MTIRPQRRGAARYGRDDSRQVELGLDAKFGITSSLDAVAFTLNTRPRKTLGWRTPAEALERLLQHASTIGVATTD